MMKRVRDSNKIKKELNQEEKRGERSKQSKDLMKKEIKQTKIKGGEIDQLLRDESS